MTNASFLSRAALWSFQKLIAFTIITLGVSFGLTFLVGFCTRPKVTISFFLNLPLINYVYQKIVTKKMQQQIDVYGEYQFRYIPPDNDETTLRQ